MSAREGARNVLVKLQTGRGRREASPATSPEIRGPCDAHRPVGVRLEHAAPAPCGDPIDCWARSSLLTCVPLYPFAAACGRLPGYAAACLAPPHPFITPALCS